MTEDADWDRFVAESDPGSYLQTSAWARVKAVNGWTAHRVGDADRAGAQILVRRPRPMPWGFAYAPRGPVAATWDAEAIRGLTDAVRRDLPTSAGRISHVRIDPEIEEDGPQDPDGALRRALDRRRLAPGTADPAERDPDHRPPAPTRTPCGATCARSGASTSTRRGPAA